MSELNPILTILGEKYEEDGKEFYLEVEDVAVHPKMKDQHHLTMLNFFKIVQTVLVKSKRDLPLMETELKKMKFLKKDINDLIKFGYLKSSQGVLVDKTDKTQRGLRNFVYWTPAGRAYVKKYIKKEETGGQRESSERPRVDSGLLQPVVPRVDEGNGVRSELPVEVQPGRNEIDGDTNNRHDDIQE